MSNFLLVPKDFDPYIYRELNPDLHNLNDEQCRDHYSINGKKENRSYFYDLPDSFDVNAYREYNKDIAGLSDKQYKLHYVKYGSGENRKYKYTNLEENRFYNPNKYILNDDNDVKKKINSSLNRQLDGDLPNSDLKIDYTVPDYFDPDLYKLLNADLIGLNDFQLKMHYIEKGIHEKRLHPAMWNSSIDFMYYKKKYEDIRLLESNIQLYDHFYFVGQYEDRKINPKFLTIKDFNKTNSIGDKLFQYAFCYCLSKKYHLDINLGRSSDSGKYSIQNMFKIDCSNSEKIDFSEGYVVKENGLSFQSSITKINRGVFVDSSKKSIILDGKFKSYKYFDSIREDLLKELSFNEDISGKANNFLNTIKDNNFGLPIVGIDFRINSLKSYHSYGPPINFSYIEAALKYIKKRVNNFIIVCCTDQCKYSSDQCKSNSDQDTCFVENFFKNQLNLSVSQPYFISNLDEGSDLCLLSMCDHLVISNSSFGWWAAYLNDKKNKLVITKSIIGQNYFFDNVVPMYERNDLLLPEWIQIENDLSTNTFDIIYSTPYMNMTLQETKLFESILCEGNEYLYQTYEYGIVIPVLNDDVSILKNLLTSVQKEFDKSYSRVIVFIIQHEKNDGLKNVIDDFHFTHLSVFKMTCCEKHNIRYYDSDQKNAFPITSKIVFDICFRIGCEHIISLDSSVILSNVFLNSIDKYLSTVKESYFIITMYSESDSKKNIEYEDNKQWTLNQIDGKFMLFNKDTFYKLLQNKMFNKHYENAFGQSIKNYNGKIYSIKQTYYNPSALNKSIVVSQK